MTAHRQPPSSHGRKMGRVGTLLTAGALGVVYWLAVRRFFSRWGTTPEERARVLPGDRLIANPTDTSTMAINVNAPPGEVWPWLVQMGYGRGGLYSYDWLDRLFGFLDAPSATSILPEFQNLAVGEKIPWGFPLGRREELTVAVLQAPSALALSYKGHGME